MAIRLDKYLCDLGIGTRSEVKKMIKSGQLTKNGVTICKPEEKIDISADKITFRGKILEYKEYEYYILNKPAGCISATEDPAHRTVLDCLGKTSRKDLFTVGRLDIDTEGLLLITNDGVLSHNLLSPAKHVPKTYFARVEGVVTPEDAAQFLSGVDIGDEKLTKPAVLTILSSDTVSQVELTISEGRFHQVKRMFHSIGKEVLYLKRISMGNLHLPEDLAQGEYRELTSEELSLLTNVQREKEPS